MASVQVIRSLDHSSMKVSKRKLADDSAIDTPRSQIAVAGTPSSHDANINRGYGGFTAGHFETEEETRYQSFGPTADDQDVGMGGM